MSIRVTAKRVSNADKVLSQRQRLLQQAIAVGGQMVMNEAKSSIQEHRSSGRTYEKYNPRRTHTSSAAGSPPNSDTGYLANNIFLVIDGDGLGADVESRAEYSEWLEFGTSKMEPRPFLQPALEVNRPKIRQLISRAIKGGL